jgi:hypothetical protein
MSTPASAEKLLPVIREARKAIADLASQNGSVSKKYDDYKAWSEFFDKQLEGARKKAGSLGDYFLLKEWKELGEAHSQLCQDIHKLAGSPKLYSWNLVKDWNAWERYKIGITFAHPVAPANFEEHNHGEEPKEFPCIIRSTLEGDEFGTWWYHAILSQREAKELFEGFQ